MLTLKHETYEVMSLKKKILCLVLITLMVLCPMLSACDSLHVADSDKLTFYCVGSENDDLEISEELYAFLKKYNKYCAVNDVFEDSVEFVYFETYNEMNSALATELMAGGGPDIMSLTQTYPFEKLVRNNSLADIDEIVSTYNADVDFTEFNETIMNSGVIDGKRCILPLYYRLNALYTTEDKLKKYGYTDADFTFESVLEKYKNDEIDTFLVNPYSAEAFYFSFIRQYMDFYEGTAEFESEEFRNLAEDFKYAILNGGTYAQLYTYEPEVPENDFEPSDDSAYLFSANEKNYYGGSLATFAEDYLISMETGNQPPVLIPDFNRNGEITASIEVGFAINANCRKMDKAAKLIEYLLSDSSQGYFGGGRDDSNSLGLSIPVKNSVFENAVKEAISYNTHRWGYKFNPENVELKNKAINEQYLPMLQRISSCNLYGYNSQFKSHLYQNVVGEVITDYLDGKITVNKLSQRLTSAVTIYMSE